MQITSKRLDGQLRGEDGQRVQVHRCRFCSKEKPSKLDQIRSGHGEIGLIHIKVGYWFFVGWFLKWNTLKAINGH